MQFLVYNSLGVTLYVPVLTLRCSGLITSVVSVTGNAEFITVELGRDCEGVTAEPPLPCLKGP